METDALTRALNRMRDANESVCRARKELIRYRDYAHTAEQELNIVEAELATARADLLRALA